MAELLHLPTQKVADVVVVGAGLCGLALARTLIARGLDVTLVEARERIGGRVLTRSDAQTGQALDLGATWYWPETEPRVSALLGELGLATLAQHDPGDALWLTDPNREPERRQEEGGVHAGARRIQGGAARLADALAAGLPEGCLQLGKPVRVLRDRGSHIELMLETGAPLRARQVVLALPPRLVHDRMLLDPPLPATVWAALEATATWMATHAKALVTFDQPFWREAGRSGNAFVRHPQAVLGEVFDACDDAGGAALGGFVALNPAQREHFQRGLPLLMESQLAQLHGQAAQGGRLQLQDWALEPWTCSDTDRATPPEPPLADPLLRQPQWSGRMFLGGSETAAHGAGHMEGALEAADRIAHALLRQKAPTAVIHEPAAHDREAALRAFAEGVAARAAAAPDQYRRHLTRLLSSQQHDLLTQRALLATVDRVYSESLAQIDALLPAIDAADAAVSQGQHALTPQLLAPFAGWNKGLLQAALAFNAGSCALSNFAQDQTPDAETQRAITLDLAAAWREFAIELNARLLQAQSVAVSA
ncbi:MAG: FAD-dependent oxidoreductase [Hydrogenophaga sp.]|uniref:flavin monoamine oxidase family protein n=1 Tax=Hydrogenophaga sp. TaxID=1904254 RepID=UPI0025BB3FD2|nr:FAD-dependent oxidoreductase [Hydrogenophaga sp.]MBT9549423.1 FAD-dependent oxidoreductase [Hydrogenophaga sp.]